MPPGLYKVVVTKLTVKEGSTLPDSIKDDPGQLEASGLGVNALPAKYASPESSGLSKDLDVGKNTFDIDLTGS